MTELMEIARKTKARRNKKPVKTPSPPSISVACRCGLPVPSARDCYHVRFSDLAELLIAKEPPWKQGYCPVLFLERLVREFDLALDGDVILAPFPFCSPDRLDARHFINAVLAMSVSGYNPDVIPVGGSC